MGGGPRPGSGRVMAEGGGSPRWGVPMVEGTLAGWEGNSPPWNLGEYRAAVEERAVGEYSWVLNSNSDFGGLARVSNMEGGSGDAEDGVEGRPHRNEWLGEAESQSS